MEWISVKDRLPQEHREYIVTDMECATVAEFYPNINRFVFDDDFWNNCNITHWAEIILPKQ